MSSTAEVSNWCEKFILVKARFLDDRYDNMKQIVDPSWRMLQMVADPRTHRLIKYKAERLNPGQPPMIVEVEFTGANGVSMTVLILRVKYCLVCNFHLIRLAHLLESNTEMKFGIGISSTRIR